MKTFYTLFKTELKLSFRGIDMFIFAICMPLVALIILGVIYSDKPAFNGASYSFFEQSFGAISSIAICAGGVMGLPLVISDYREKKILKRFKVTPISPVMLLGVQIGIYAFYSIFSLISLFFIGTIFFHYKMQGSLIDFMLGYCLIMISTFSIGIMVGGISTNTKIAGIIASVLYFPMLIFSGATLPYEIMPKVLQKFASFMPLTHGIKLLKSASLGLPINEAITPFLIMITLAFVCIFISIKFFKWE